MKSNLETALKSWLTLGGSLGEMIPRGSDRVESGGEAKLICSALDKALSVAPIEKYTQASYNLSTAIALFQNVESERAAAVLRSQGLPRLRSLVRAYIEKHHLDSDTMVFVAKILATYGELMDVDLVLQLSRDPNCEDGYLWSVVFNIFTSQDESVARIVEALRYPLPNKFCRVAFLDFCNRVAMRGALPQHPFDSPDGLSVLRQWLSSGEESQFSYAISATAALPFINRAASAELAVLAAAHPDVNVRIESAWAQAKGGERLGLDALTDFARNPLFARRAIRYLEDLGHTDSVPEESRTPDAMALAEMAQWLAHPNELGRPPEEVAIADTREIFWPPANDRRRLWVIRYKHWADDQLTEGYGLVGSTTWAMFDEASIRDPMDVYAVHCCWELQHTENPRAPPDRLVSTGRRILAERNPEFGLRGV